MSRAPESVYLKLARAKEHTAALKAEIAKFGEVRPVAIATEINEDRRKVAIKTVVLRGAPVTWSLVFGECIHDLRTALDHLAYALPRSFLADPKWEDSSQFPICDTRTKFKRQLSRMEGMHPDTVRALDAAQPYFGRDQPEGQGLWYLRKFSNLDKHRLSPVVVHALVRGTFEDPVVPTGTAHIQLTGAEPEHGATVAYIHFSDPAPKDFDLTIHLDSGVFVRLPDYPPVGLTTVLEQIYDTILSVISTLEPHLDRPHMAIAPSSVLSLKGALPT
jgi:hypothetical protein